MGNKLWQILLQSMAGAPIVYRYWKPLLLPKSVSVDKCCENEIKSTLYSHTNKPASDACYLARTRSNLCLSSECNNLFDTVIQWIKHKYHNKHLNWKSDKKFRALNCFCAHGHWSDSVASITFLYFLKGHFNKNCSSAIKQKVVTTSYVFQKWSKVPNINNSWLKSVQTRKGTGAHKLISKTTQGPIVKLSSKPIIQEDSLADFEPTFKAVSKPTS